MIAHRHTSIRPASVRTEPVRGSLVRSTPVMARLDRTIPCRRGTNGPQAPASQRREMARSSRAMTGAMTGATTGATTGAMTGGRAIRGVFPFGSPP